MPLKLKSKDILINQEFHDMIAALISFVVLPMKARRDKCLE
ncbi:MAG TPA: hypothetical protein VI584_04095 [Nitrospiria bacterium]|nr:hypothetical protein [Nitrospiria bacterium]